MSEEENDKFTMPSNEEKEKARAQMRKAFDEMTPEEQKALGEEMAAILRDNIMPQILESYRKAAELLQGDPEAVKKEIEKMARK
tara:strand:+ start:9802 stop:10053 length:252 start_codon:yes stop_codon:yes gene_type:complete